MAFIRESVLNWNDDGPTMPEIDFQEMYLTDEVIDNMDRVTATWEMKLVIDDTHSPGDPESETVLSQVWRDLPAEAINELHDLMQQLYAHGQAVSSSWGDAMAEVDEQAGGDKAKKRELMKQAAKQQREARRKRRQGGGGD